jgi:hypothetical protein
MAGVYVALPPVTPDTPDKPPGWGDWPYPGAYPPGYTPDYSIALVTSSSVIVGGNMALVATLRDHATYETNEPKSGSVISWTAAVDGEAVQLMVGEGDYAAYLSSVYTEIGDFWGAQPTVTPQLTESHVDKTLVVTATTVIDGETIIETAEVEITSTPVDPYEYTVRVAISWTGGTYLSEPLAGIYHYGTQMAWVGWVLTDTEPFGVYEESEWGYGGYLNPLYDGYGAITTGNPATIELTAFSGKEGTYTVYLDDDKLYDGCEVTATCNILLNGVTVATYNATRTFSSGAVNNEWLIFEFSSSPGVEFTLLNDYS